MSYHSALNTVAAGYDVALRMSTNVADETTRGIGEQIAIETFDGFDRAEIDPGIGT